MPVPGFSFAGSDPQQNLLAGFHRDFWLPFTRDLVPAISVSQHLNHVNRTSQRRLREADRAAHQPRSTPTSYSPLHRVLPGPLLRHVKEDEAHVLVSDGGPYTHMTENSCHHAGRKFLRR